MKLAKLITYWKLRCMISQSVTLSHDHIYMSDKRHVIKKITVCKSGMTARIIYKTKEQPVHNKQVGIGSAALIYADILFSGQSIDELFIENATLAQIAEYLR